MYYIANLETQAIQTYRDGTRIVYASKELAENHAAIGQELTGVPFAVVPISLHNVDALSREVAAWVDK